LTNSERLPVSNKDLLEESDDIVSFCVDTEVTVLFQHVPREFNQEADELSRQGAIMQFF